jgi:hypothetical protein
MSITHAFVSVVGDGGDPAQVRPSNWNAAHTFLAETTDPVSPVDRQVWVVVSGTSPTRTTAIKIRDAGVTYTIASITY